MSDLRHNQKRVPQQPLLGYSDGRREFGTVAAAIRRVMEEAGGELQVRDVRREAEVLLGGVVSRFTVADHLIKHSTGDTGPYERTPGAATTGCDASAPSLKRLYSVRPG